MFNKWYSIRKDDDIRFISALKHKLFSDGHSSGTYIPVHGNENNYFQQLALRFKEVCRQYRNTRKELKIIKRKQRQLRLENQIMRESLDHIMNMCSIGREWEAHTLLDAQMEVEHALREIKKIPMNGWD